MRRHEAEARELWQTYVPASGQADTVQGELIRAVGRLRDEAYRNGNANWDDGFQTMLFYLTTTLMASGVFDEQAMAEITEDFNRLLNVDNPPLDDGPYDRLSDRVVEWARAHPDPVPREHDPDLHR